MYSWLFVHCTRHITYRMQTIPSVFTWLHLKIILRPISLHLSEKKTEPRSCKNYDVSYDIFQFCFAFLFVPRSSEWSTKSFALVYENLFVSDHLYFLDKPVHNLYSLWRIYLQCLLTFPSHSALSQLSWFVNHRDQVTPKETLFFHHAGCSNYALDCDDIAGSTSKSVFASWCLCFKKKKKIKILFQRYFSELITMQLFENSCF